METCFVFLVFSWINFFFSLLAFRNEGNPLLQIEVEPTSDVSPSFDLQL